ncbi:MAG: ATP-binding protein [Pseudomonadota bacterium]
MTAAPPASAEPVDLTAGQGIADLKPHLRYKAITGARPGAMLKSFQTGGFEPELNTSFLAANHAAEAWAAVTVRNASPDDGREGDPFVLALSLALVSEADIYLVRDEGLTEHLLRYSLFRPFDENEHAVNRLRTPQLDIAPGETVTLLVSLKLGPFHDFRLALETPSEHEASVFNDGIISAAFYAFSIAALVFGLGFHAAMRNWVGVGYAALFCVALALIAFIDGHLFRFFFPDDPQWQSPVGFGLLFGLSGFGFVAAQASIAQEERGTGFRAILLVLIGASLCGFGFSLFSPGPFAAVAAYGLIGLMILVQIYAGRLWMMQGGRIHFGGIGIAVLAALSLIFLFSLLSGAQASGGLLVPEVLKITFAILLTVTLGVLSINLIHLRRQNARAIAERMEALEAENTRSRELLEAQENAMRARDLASLRQRQLATASHDFKQPLSSLRMTFDSIADQASPEVRARLNEAFDYMEALSGQYLAETTPESKASDGQDELVVKSASEPATPERADEAYSLSVVLGTVEQMFFEEAISKGLKLLLVDCSLETDLPPIILMRILTNLVSNAVKYTKQGRVMLGVRRAGNAAIIHVFDTGPGMSETQFQRLRQEHQKGDQSSGHGLGLAVCFELARQNDLDLDYCSIEGKGSLFRLTIPVVAT